MIGGRRVTHWPGQRSQLLMQFLAAHRPHQAVYELRSILRAAEPSHQPVVCTGGGYELAADLPEPRAGPG